MCLNKVFNESNDINFEKCGEIIVSAKHNVIAMVCALCNDLFIHSVEFLRHLQQEHDDELRFSTDVINTCAYTVEELMSIPENGSSSDITDTLYYLDDVVEEDAINNEEEESLTIDISPRCTEDKTLEKCSKIQNKEYASLNISDQAKHIKNANEQNDTTPNILEAFKEFDISIGLLDEFNNSATIKKNEVDKTSAELSKIPNNINTIGNEKKYQKDSRKFQNDNRQDRNTIPAIKTNSTLKNNIHAEKLPLSCSNFKTKENVTEPENQNSAQIFKLPSSISIKKLPLKNQNEIIFPQPITTETPIKSNYCKQNFDDRSITSNANTFVKPTAVLHSLNSKNDQICEKTPLNRDTNGKKTFGIHRGLKTKEVMKRMQHIKKQIFNELNKGNYENLEENFSITNPKKQKDKIKIENVEILDNICIKSTLGNSSDSKENLERKIPNNKETGKIEKSPTKDDSQGGENSEKTTCEKFLIKEIEVEKKEKQKRKYNEVNTENENKESKKIKLSTDNSANLDDISSVLSESTDKFLTDDLKNSKINVSGLLDETDFGQTEQTNESLEIRNPPNEDNILEELINHVTNENPIQVDNSTLDAEKSNYSSYYLKDLELLDSVGLKALHCPEYDMRLTLDELNENYAKSEKLANLIKQNIYLWCANVGLLRTPDKVDNTFKILTEKVNKIFKFNMTINNMKRIFNLVVLWYTETCDNKLIDKKSNPTSNAYYEKLFNFMPKTGRRYYYCEFCSEIFANVSRYLTHRMTHTAVYPYSCKYCGRNFKQKIWYMKHCLKDTCNTLRKKRRTSVL